MTTDRDLVARGFHACEVTPLKLNIDHADPGGRGPFCRLQVATEAQAQPGVYAWTVDREVRYVGRADALIQVVRGARMNRAFNDYTYIPPSEVTSQLSSPRVRVNGLLNRALCDDSVVKWWWINCESSASSVRLEAELIAEWAPAWNRARPVGGPSRTESAPHSRSTLPRVHLMCGLNGAGKSTVASQLIEGRGVRFRLDEWILRLFGLRFDDPDYPARASACKDLVWETAAQVLRSGSDVVLDWNHWSAELRAASARRARALGFEPVVQFVDVPLEVAVYRMAERNQLDDPLQHEIQEAGVRHLAALFERPSDAEGIAIRRHDSSK